MMQEIFNQVEELVGTYPTGENLRSAVHAIITKNLFSSPSYPWSLGSYTIMKNVDYIARTYEHARGTTQYLNGLFSRER
jgi:hypothetical protein